MVIKEVAGLFHFVIIYLIFCSPHHIAFCCTTLSLTLAMVSGGAFHNLICGHYNTYYTCTPCTCIPVQIIM